MFYTFGVLGRKKVLIAALTAALLGAEAERPALGDALARLQAGDAAGAAQILETITRREPQNGRAWRTLGAAYLAGNDADRAITAFRRALEVQPEMIGPIYNMALAYAEKKDADNTFAWLEKARATHRIDMTQAEVAPELAPYRRDPRFAAVLPRPSDFADPFVERAKIIHEWDGEAAGDQFGWIARSIGDVDGDGVPDFVTSAPSKNVGGADAGRVYVYSSKSGALLWSVDGRPGDELGTGVEAAGDANHD